MAWAADASSQFDDVVREQYTPRPCLAFLALVQKDVHLEKAGAKVAATEREMIS
jgi:hypothetical protein